MKTLDLRKEYAALYRPSPRKVELVDVPELLFLRVDGCIEPGATPGTSPAFAEATGALYGAAYTLKFMSKKRPKNAIDYPVMALEAIWWVSDGRFNPGVKDNWRWRAMIMQPDHITQEMFEEARESLRKKKPSPALEALVLERFTEGLCVQTLHVGPYATEPATVERMTAFEADHGLVARHEKKEERGRFLLFDHHEIYLGDPRRAAPDKLKTVLRHPVYKA